MYEAVHADPEGRATVARLALTAREHGYDGVVVRNHVGEQPSYDAETVAAETGVDVVDGVELRADDPESASGYLGNYRPDHAIVAVHGGSTAMNRFAVEQPKVDVLAHPMAGDGDVNHVIANAAAEHGVRLEFDLRRVLRSTGGNRVRAIQGLRKLAELVEDADAPYVVSAAPRSHLQLRAPRELAALGEAIGLDADAVEDGLREWARLAERNRDRQSESFVEPGVRVVDDGSERASDGEADRASDGEADRVCDGEAEATPGGEAKHESDDDVNRSHGDAKRDDGESSAHAGENA